ncbi:MAG: glyoxalase superfamily protein, partial [Planctomycetales bacterium]
LGKCVPNLPVRDAPSAIQWYMEVLGFTMDFDDAVLGFNHTMYACLSRDEFTICINEHDDSEEPHDLWCNVDGIHDLYEEFVGKEVEDLGKPQKMPWGSFEMKIKDPNGHVICFTQDEK